MPTSKPQKKLEEILKSIFGPNVKRNYRGFDWLRSDLGRKQEIDIWIPSIKLAVEYDGEQHFYPVNFGGISDKEAKANFKRMVELDKMKTASIENNKDVKYFIRFNYKDILEKDLVVDRLCEMNIEIPSHMLESIDDWLYGITDIHTFDNFIDYDIIY